MMTRGVFTISIDYEFGDYAFGRGRPERTSCPDEARLIGGEAGIVRRLLCLFEEFRVPATWAVVSHLLQTRCLFSGDIPHPDYPRPVYFGEDADWFFQHPAPGEVHDPLWFDSENLIPKILSSSMRHEIASHSYAHIDLGAANVNEKAAKYDISKARFLHKERGLPFETFVFPWNREGFHMLLKEAGVKRYRGCTPRWYDGLPGVFKRAARLLEYLLPTAPPAVAPSFHPSGLLNIPDSMLLLRREGIRRVVPARVLLRKALRGVRRAAEEKRIFHLWFHPFNFCYDTEMQLNVLREILKEAARLREQGAIDILTMAEIHDRV